MAQLAARDWGLQTDRQVLISSFDHCNWFCDAFGFHVGLPPAVVERMKRAMVTRNNGRFDWDRTSVVEMLRHSPRPTLLVHDEDDLEIPFTESVALSQAWQGSTLEAVTHLGHRRILRAPFVVERSVAFLVDHSSRS